MDVKEKIVELLGKVQQMGVIYRENQMDERYPTVEQIRNTEVAARLIANGVTVQYLDGCKYCEEYEDLPEHFIDGKPVGRVFDTCIQPNENGLWHLEVPCGADIGIRFCPMCGRRLPQPQKGE